MKYEVENRLNEKFIDLEKMNGCTILITGATGLIGTALIDILSYISQRYKLKIRVIALVRNLDRAQNKFKYILSESNFQLKFVEGNVEDMPTISENIEFIVHGASITSSSDFVNRPVEVIDTAIRGTTNMLKIAVEKQVLSMVYLSSMEIYGSPDTDRKIAENHSNNINTMMPRSSYPESKRMCESLCLSFFKEYNAPVKVARLTQTFGPGVSYEDTRVFAEFSRCVLENRDIILRTKGETKRNYLYVDDAVSAVLTLLLKGKNGEAYNVANEDTYCSISEMAKLVADMAGGKIKVIYEIPENLDSYGYAPPLKMNLDTSKIRELGWCPTKGLIEMYENLIEDWRRKKCI